jgi:hypothetical protein
MRWRLISVGVPSTKISILLLRSLLLSVLWYISYLCAPIALGVPFTMRVDYYHTGSSTQELFSLDRVVMEPLPWPGDLSQTIDHTNLGNYLFEVHDQGSGRLLYSRGFNSIYGEWVTTDEAKKMNRTFSESLRFPAPTATVEVVLKKRNESGFHEIWTTIVDPKSRFIDTSRPVSPGPLLTIQKTGEPKDKVDLLILCDGYKVAERPKFERDARRLTEILFSTSPFKERRRAFNVWGLCPAAEESGISRPSNGLHRRNPLGSTYDTFNTERYVLTTENRTLRDVASYAPYEFIQILVNAKTYGGGGIFNLYGTAAADSDWAPYEFVHEFGHVFAALADEYYTSPVAYAPSSTRIEPWEPNVTALLDLSNVKWKTLVKSGIPIPTPWRKAEFEAYDRDMQTRRVHIRENNLPESEMDRLFEEEHQHETGLLDSDKFARTVGAFEGANYESRGYYRPEENCIMFTRIDSFCSVCRAAIERIIALYSK